MKRGALIFGMFASSVAAALIACVGDDAGVGASSSSGSSGATPTNDGQAPGTDGAVDPGSDGGADSATSRCDPKKPFVLTDVTELNSANVSNFGARLTADELTVYWSRSDPGPQLIPPTTTWVAKRSTKDGTFTGAQAVVGVAKPQEKGDLYPFPTPQGDLLFHSDRGNTRDIWLSKYVNGTFTAPTPFAPLATEEAGERMPYMSRDGKEIWLTHDVLSPPAGTPRTRVAVALEVAAGSYGAPKRVELGGAVAELELGPVISADRTTLYFARGTKVYKTTRPNETTAFGPAVPVTELNTTDDSAQPTWVSDDDCIIYIQSNRPASDPISRVFRGVRPK